MEFAILVGVIGGVLCTVGMHLLEKFRVDDVVGAIPAHLIAGIWGTIAAAIFGGANMGAQLLGIFAIGAFVMATSFGLWLILKLTTGIRVSESDENLGQDLVELGMEAYPEFMTLSEDDIQEAIRHKESKLASKSKPKNE
jgi:Amt family ammonium transporter